MRESMDLATTEGHHKIELTESEQLLLASLFEGIERSPYEDVEGFLLDAALTFHRFPWPLRRETLAFKRFSNKEGILLVRNLPTDPKLPSTPEDSGHCREKNTYASELWLGAFGMALGEPIAYMQEKDGELFRNVCPTRENEREWSSESSRIFLPFHTETAFHPFMPSYVMLYCLRPDHEGAARSKLASIRRIARLMSGKQLEVLRQPLFETGIDYSFGSTTGKKGGGLVTAICYGDRQDPYFRYDPDLMIPHSPEGREVMDVLNRCIEDVAAYVTLTAGDLLIIDNRRTVHARTEFVARYDGRDRWLQRVYLVDSLAPSAEDRKNDRIIRTQFSV